MYKMFTPLTDFHRKYSHLRGSIITIDGPVGVGKSTVGQQLEKIFNDNGMKASYFCEYVNQEFLDLFLSDMSKYAYTFQLFMLNKRLEIYREVLRIAMTGCICIIDRSIIGDECFFVMMVEKGFITEAEKLAYYSIRNFENKLVPNYMIYLTCTVETALSRINKRNRKGEVDSYDSGYIGELILVHDILIGKLASQFPNQVILIDWNGTQETVNPELLLNYL